MFEYGTDKLTASIALKIAKGTLKGQLSSNSVEKVNQTRKIVRQIAGGDDSIYGINTGFGPLCSKIISKENRTKLQKKLLISHAVGMGDPVDPIIAKLMLILKVQALSKGYSGISLEILERIIWHINHDVIPVVPSQGSVGASGDLAPLSHLFLPLIGLGKVFYKGQERDSMEVLQEFSMDPVPLHPKAGLALINGTQFIAAHAVVVLDRYYKCLSHADLIGALMIDALQGSQMPFHPRLHETRPHPGCAHVAHRVYNFLSGSSIMADHNECEKVQDPYSLRCMPQVHGSSRDTWLHLKKHLEIELNAVTDNPIILDEQLIISGGNFHGQPLALPLDFACLGLAELGNISDRRSYLSLFGHSKAPKLLLKEIGMDSGFMITQYTSAALASENKTLCFPASADSIPTSLGQEDHVSMGSISGRKALQVVKNVEQILAVELLLASQALDFNRPLKSSHILEEVHTLVRKKVSFATEDRLFGQDMETLKDLILSGELLTLLPTIQSPYNDDYEQY